MRFKRKKAMNSNKITPCLWFNTKGGAISEVLEYYKNIFTNDLEEGKIMQLGETPSGNTEICEVKLFGQKYTLMSTAEEHHPFNDSVSFTINCKDQQEIDRVWDYFTQEGQESQCGWCFDKYGFRWQVIPENLNELMSRPNAWKVMMGQKKIVIQDYLA